MFGAEGAIKQLGKKRMRYYVYNFIVKTPVNYLNFHNFEGW